MSGRWLTRIAAAVLFVSLAVSTLPRLVTIVNNARTLLPLTYEARRERQMGPWYASVEKLRRELRANEPVALITSRRDIDSAVFANYYLFPIHTRLFVGRNAYRNAAPDRTRPAIIVAVNASHAERTEYDILRDRDLAAGRRIVAEPELSAPMTAFVLPLAASLDGPPPGTFVIEATLANPNPVPAEVRITFWPKGLTRTIAIPARTTKTYYDLVYQLFGIMNSGWMRVESSQPLRAAFYFVNRGRGDATLMPNAIADATRIAPAPLHRDTKLFVINPKDSRATVILNGESIPLDPHAFISRPIETLPTISGDVYAFVTTRELDGRTDFLWPAK
jgi:hypothetical protein